MKKPNNMLIKKLLNTNQIFIPVIIIRQMIQKALVQKLIAH